MPAEVAGYLREQGHQAWTAYEATLEAASDEELLIYAADKGAVAVTINKDFVALARRLRSTRVVYLRVREHQAVVAMGRALDWMQASTLPEGRVLRVPLKAEVMVLAPRPL